MGIDILNPIRGELRRVDNLMATYLKTPYQEIGPFNDHTRRKSGKKLRPAITILFGRMCGLDDERTLKLGACLELLHTSTLIHDDVIDNAATRRGQETHNALWDNTLTVLYGDFVFSSAMQLAVELGDLEALRMISALTRDLVTGELLQHANGYQFPPSRERYAEIIRLKTAVLFSGCCALPVVMTGQEELVEPAARIGSSIGTAFQVIDDCLDFMADERLGKPRLIDLEEGKATLPVLLALENGDAAIGQIVRRVFEERNLTTEDGETLVDALDRGGYLGAALDDARQTIRGVREDLDLFPSSRYRETFRKVCDFIIDREF